MTFQKGQSGDPAGRLRGARNKRTLAAESMFDRDLLVIIEKVIDLAKDGDIAAIRICLERICPEQRERPVSLELPPTRAPTDAVAAMGAIVEAVSDGDLGAGEASDLAKIVAGFAQTIGIHRLEQRLEDTERIIALLKQE